ncbi:hypothetical protein PCANC_01343 [Puccinia coronata f. sp. avenae]|uniref:Uncharacterized protein n=1 Tax=Puccinia coronata f. sp. avenae TaxID=200324 RepID=A0A2N5W6B1_9BASI|nr:hypothetical protein PCANC_17883 [Puccinia coronata f. sp. avenae]PLW57760.1 hypothetical protein PCANC_01343 [Puccinia coronata f. sp. avenae]
MARGSQLKNGLRGKSAGLLEIGRALQANFQKLGYDSHEIPGKCGWCSYSESPTVQGPSIYDNLTMLPSSGGPSYAPGFYFSSEFQLNVD